MTDHFIISIIDLSLIIKSIYVLSSLFCSDWTKYHAHKCEQDSNLTIPTYNQIIIQFNDKDIIL